MILRSLMEAAPYLAPIAAGVGLVAWFGRDRSDADEHDLSDYHQPLDPELNELRERLVAALKRGGPAVVLPPTQDDILPPAPPGMNAGSPLFRAVAVDMVLPTLTDDEVRRIAARWLREIGAEEQAKAGVHPYAADHWASLDGSCWADCPACARDLTGAFPVVRAA